MQQYDIVVGLNGAGFMNTLYLPPGGVAIQLAPYKANLNIDQFATLVSSVPRIEHLMVHLHLDALLHMFE